jgi:hypothetical protein
MNHLGRPVCRVLRLAGVLALGVVAPSPASAAELSSTPPAAARVAPPLPPIPQSPVALFRELLAATPEQLETRLSGRTEAYQHAIRTKVREYHTLPAPEREARLAATEFRWYLRTLLGLSPANRPQPLQQAPATLRPLLEQRLREWDQLPTQTQRDLLQYERTLANILGPGTSARETAPPSRPTPPVPHPDLNRQLERWQSLPEDQREKAFAQFQKFFELSPRQKEKTLNTLSESERRQMESTLRAFERLAPEQRLLCLRSFEKFVSLSPRERSEFLRSADRWSDLDPADREVWRRLVTQMPPLPPGFGRPPLPPMPNRTGSLSRSPQLATNTPPTEGL